MAQHDGLKPPKSSFPIGIWSVGFLCGIVFFKLVMVGVGFDMLKQGTYLTNEVIARDFIAMTQYKTKLGEIDELKTKYDEIVSKKEVLSAIQEKRTAYENELKQLFQQGLKISTGYQATNAEAIEGKIWEDKTRQVLEALSRIETQLEGHSVNLDFQGNFIWYDETNPNYKHAREIVLDRLNDLRRAFVVLDTSDVAVADPK